MHHAQTSYLVFNLFTWRACDSDRRLNFNKGQDVLLLNFYRSFWKKWQRNASRPLRVLLKTYQYYSYFMNSFPSTFDGCVRVIWVKNVNSLWPGKAH